MKARRYTDAEVREQIVTAFKLGMKIGRLEERRSIELDRETDDLMALASAVAGPGRQREHLAPVVPLRLVR